MHHNIVNVLVFYYLDCFYFFSLLIMLQWTSLRINPCVHHWLLNHAGVLEVQVMVNSYEHLKGYLDYQITFLSSYRDFRVAMSTHFFLFVFEPDFIYHQCTYIARHHAGIVFFNQLHNFKKHGLLLPQFYGWENWGKTIEVKFSVKSSSKWQRRNLN